jgi:hypothetical protein
MRHGARLLLTPRRCPSGSGRAPSGAAPAERSSSASNLAPRRLVERGERAQTARSAAKCGSTAGWESVAKPGETCPDIFRAARVGDDVARQHRSAEIPRIPTNRKMPAKQALSGCPRDFQQIPRIPINQHDEIAEWQADDRWRIAPRALDSLSVEPRASRQGLRSTGAETAQTAQTFKTTMERASETGRGCSAQTAQTARTGGNRSSLDANRLSEIAEFALDCTASTAVIRGPRDWGVVVANVPIERTRNRTGRPAKVARDQAVRSGNGGHDFASKRDRRMSPIGLPSGRGWRGYGKAGIPAPWNGRTRASSCRRGRTARAG